ncbi:MAG: hypothetical protein HRU35_00595 [Rickettsiaceae bacterium]|nr:hypothetical protein [Rickettsiaceae bacterium]
MNKLSIVNKLTIPATIIAAILSTWFFISVAVTDYDEIYQEFMKTSRISEESFKDIKVRVIKFPMPYIRIATAKEENKVELEKIEIKFSFFSFLKFDPKISDINVKNAKIYLKHDDVSLLNHDEFIAELINKDALNISTNIETLTFVESDDDVPLVIKDFDYSGWNDNFKFSGKVHEVGKIEGSVSKNLVDEKPHIDWDLYITGNGYSFKLNEKYVNSILTSGNGEIHTSNLPNKISKLFPDISDLSQKFNSKEDVKITFNISSTNNWLVITNIAIDSESLKGSGNMSFSKIDTDLDEIKFDFAKIDIYNWSKGDDKDVTSFNYASKAKFDFNKKHLSLDITAQHIQLDENNALSDLEIKSTLKDGKFNIDKCIAVIDNTGKFNATGVITQNSFRNLFNGKVVLNHRDLNDIAEFIGNKEIRATNPIPYSLSADIKLSSVDVSLQNLIIKTKDTEITGNVSTKFIGNTPRTNASLKFSHVNFAEDSLPAFAYIYNYVNSLTDGMKSDDYLNKFIPLRKIQSVGNYDITFKQLIFKDKKYQDVNVNLTLAPAFIKLDNLYVSDGTNFIDTDIDITAQGIKPIIKILINDGIIKGNILSPQSLLDLRNKMLNDYALDKIELDLNFYLSRYYQNGLTLDNIIFKANNNNNLFNISKFDADVLGGKFSSSASVLMEPYTINLVYALNSASLKEIAKLLPKDFLKSGGAISANGLISTNGDKLNEQLYNLYTKSTILAKNLTINDFSIDELIEKTNSADYTISELDKDIKKTLLTGSTEIADLKTELTLTKGVFTLSDLVFKTKYTAGSGNANINIYDFNIDLATIFSFNLNRARTGRAFTEQMPGQITLKATGSVFSPKKEADSKSLREILKKSIE